MGGEKTGYADGVEKENFSFWTTSLKHQNDKFGARNAAHVSSKRKHTFVRK